MTFWLPLSFCCLFVGFLHHFSTNQGSSRRIFTVDEHVGIAVCGLLADGRQLVNRARDEAASYKEFYGCQIPGKVLAERLAGFVHAYTMYWSVRPFGSAVLIAGKDADGPFMWMVEPSGLTYNYFGCAIGKGKQPAKVEIEKLKLGELTCREVLKDVARIIYSVHDDVKDKEFELELRYACFFRHAQSIAHIGMYVYIMCACKIIHKCSICTRTYIYVCIYDHAYAHMSEVERTHTTRWQQVRSLFVCLPIYPCLFIYHSFSCTN